MMAFLAKLLTGAGSSVLTVPALILALLVAAHQWRENRDGRLKAEGKATCDASWELAIRRTERDAAAGEARRASEILEGERRVTERLTNALQQLQREYAEHRAAASDNPRCLSDGVLDLLRKHGAVGGG